MATKIDTSVEPLNLQSTVNSPKVSKFGLKSGFVIPKNKLSGSLVPIFRSSEKVDSRITIKEESNRQVQRKTKWGIDMTEDTSIKKGRLLAYQTRLEQITKKLKMESGSHQGLKFQSVSSTSTQDPSKGVIIDEIQRQNLELEKHEVIGEILQLNPSYNAPLDYKPLLKEAKVPIPIKVHREYNFIRLLLGSESNTQKRLEEETGAKIRVYGTKTDTKEKCEITQSDLNEAQSTYEKVYVLVSADNYNKIDAAVALLELLVTPASINPAVSVAPTVSTTALDSGITFNPSLMQSTPSYTVIKPGAFNQAAAPTVHAPAGSGPMQYETYRGTWFSVNSTNAALQPPSSCMPSPNTPSFLGVHHPFGSVSNSPDVASGSQPPNHHPGFTPTSFPAVNQPTPLGTARTTIPSQPIPMAPMGTLPNRPLAPPMIPPVGSNNIQMTPHPQNPIVSSPCHQNLRQNFPLPSNFTVQPSTRASIEEPTFMSRPWSAPSHNNATSAPLSVQLPVSSQPTSLPMVPQQPSTGMVLNKPPGPPPMIVPRPPPCPISGDFTFQPLRAQVAAPLNRSQMPVFAGCGSSPQNSSQIPFDVAQSALHQNNSQMWIGVPPFMPQMQRPATPLGAMGHGSSAVAQMGHFPNIGPPSSSHFPNLQNIAAPMAPPLNQRGPPSFFPAHRIPNLQGTLPRRQPLPTLTPLQNPMAPAAQSHGFLAQSQPMGMVVGSGRFGNHVYNPSSPLQKRNEQTNAVVTSEPDPEYDDLMASVGVR